MISAKVIADSKNEFGNRITTMVVTMPRIILAEFNTHRMFSRNSASSRAIPFEKMVKSVEENPFIPIAWQKDHKGMQGAEYLGRLEGYGDWIVARDCAIRSARHLSEKGITKQLCNRLLEPFMYHTVIVTATEWENFFALRCPQYAVPYTWDAETKIFKSKKDATKYWQDKADSDITIGQPTKRTELEWLKMNIGQAEIHMMALAEAMWDAFNESIPKELKAGKWHIPFGDKFDMDQMHEVFMPSNPDDLHTMNEEWNGLRIKIATARCAQVSYTVVGEEGKEMNYEKLIALHDRLAKSGHWSPFEHCAKSGEPWEKSSGNLKGFVQYKMFFSENITK